MKAITKNTLFSGYNKARWLDDPHKKAGRIKGEGGQIEMFRCTQHDHPSVILSEATARESS